MFDCTRCRESFLDHLYGLLEPAEDSQLLDHVAGCAECRVARAEAEKIQRLLAAAARADFPEVTFSPPADDAVSVAKNISDRVALPFKKLLTAFSGLEGFGKVRRRAMRRNSIRHFRYGHVRGKKPSERVVGRSALNRANVFPGDLKIREHHNTSHSRAERYNTQLWL